MNDVTYQCDPSLADVTKAHMVVMLTFIEGSDFADHPNPNDDAYYEVGKFCGQISNALQVGDDVMIT